MSGSPCARRTRTMKQCASDARTMGRPTHRPFESTATGIRRERSGARWTRAVGPSPTTYPKNSTRHQREREEREQRSAPPVESRRASPHGKPVTAPGTFISVAILRCWIAVFPTPFPTPLPTKTDAWQQRHSEKP